MRDWKKRWIVAGVLLFVAACIFVYRLSIYEDEAALITDARIVESEQQLQEALKQDGYVYVKGELEGDLDSENITLIDGILSNHPKNTSRGYKDVFLGAYISLDVVLGRYEYNPDTYKQSGRWDYSFVPGETKKLVTKTVTVFGISFPVGDPEKLVERAGVYKNPAGTGSLVKDAEGRMVPSIETPKDTIAYEGYALHAIPARIDAVLKLHVKDGKPVDEDMEIIATADFDVSKELADTGTFDYGTEIVAYLILWILMTLVAWLIMRMLGL